MTARISTWLAFALPVAGLAGLWGWTDSRSQQGMEWLVPIQGYDPRDLLQGHYVQFSYDWPETDSKRADDGLPGFRGRDSYRHGACLAGTAPRLTHIEPVPKPDEPQCGEAAFLAPSQGSFINGPSIPWSGRLYVSQAEGRRLERKLRDQDQQGYIRIRLRPDGTIMPLSLSFRPLTEAEKAAREAEAESSDAPDDPPVPEITPPE